MSLALPPLFVHNSCESRGSMLIINYLVKLRSRPKVNRPAAGGHVHERFAPESKPVCGRWACKRPKRNRPASVGHVQLYTGTWRPKVNWPAVGGHVD